MLISLSYSSWFTSGKKYRLLNIFRRESFCKILLLLFPLFFSLRSTSQTSKLSDYGTLSSNDRISYLFTQLYLNYTPEVFFAKLDSLQGITESLKDERALDYILLFRFCYKFAYKPYEAQNAFPPRALQVNAAKKSARVKPHLTYNIINTEQNTFGSDILDDNRQMVN